MPTNTTLNMQSCLEANIEEIRKQTCYSDDLIIRKVRVGAANRSIQIALVYFDGLSDEQLIYQFILEPLMQERISAEGRQHAEVPDLLLDSILTVGQINKFDSLDSAVQSLMKGCVVVVIDGCTEGLQIPMAGWEQRAVTEPTNQTVIRGPKEAFTENIHVNVALIRRIVKSPSLVLKKYTVGRVTQTNVSIMYIDGLTPKEVIDEVVSRIESIDTDAILESGYIEEFIQDETFTIFPTIINTERPDSIAGSLLEGRVAILIDGTPHVLLVPSLFVQFFQAAEDYYHRADISTIIRGLRYFALFIATLVPALYIAITTYHQEMIPTQLLISLAAQREGVPFPAFVEAIIMEATYEILREAGVRMPRAVGQAVSIVGTLVIGQAAVEAGIISASMIIVVSITAISSYVIPEFDMSIAVRISRFLFMGLAAAFGMFGIFIGIIAILLHLTSLRSFGIPYMSPVGPFNFGDQKDVILRVTQRKMNTRPSMFGKLNPFRQWHARKAK
ncbi:spore germination protein KA [Paenibacillus sp. CCS19]|uniref:spore germination protein n=1 Tax=Paenibacillus sp. CCS19 TaxID=3158387 RepID=UPI00255DF321|nr:spore germination protein [Paenibacillus cellulosilyticus]GMK41865.1 spore germination protein KA [Paenibacillus cellulosilyticus]